VGLGEQTRSLARHAPLHRVDGQISHQALLLQQLTNSSGLCWRLGHGQTVAGHNEMTCCVSKHGESAASEASAPTFMLPSMSASPSPPLSPNWLKITLETGPIPSPWPSISVSKVRQSPPTVPAIIMAGFWRTKTLECDGQAGEGVIQERSPLAFAPPIGCGQQYAQASRKE